MRTRSGFATKPVVAILALAAAVAGWVVYNESSSGDRERKVLADRSVNTLFTNMPRDEKMDAVYFDTDLDLVADTPEEATLLAKPTELVFSFVATDNSSNDAAVWEAAVEAISEKTGLPVSYLRLVDTRKQMAALRGGQLHITAFDSGSVPVAVKHAGFIPLCTISNAEGSDPKAKAGEAESPKTEKAATGQFGYKMQFIVKVDSQIKDLADLRGKNIAFVRPNSNSGCKAAMVHLWQMDLRPEHDYNWHFTLSHANSVRNVTEGRADAAPVASDILQRLVSKGDVARDSFRVIYESSLFPPVAVGCSYNLPSKLREEIRDALLNLDWTDTTLAKEMAPGEPKKFVPVVYRDDWASVRAVDQAVSSVRDQIAVR
ncbi:phosphate/phosphite/phosphonate ABC transporter substrate-binding protein [Adhaeretor mobilis]|uniref:Phosphate-import protein PhnD n=1 Tax=Adhaeretor mobilis TaxID=1930276 RepID=A0A517MT06_9BACT|nr:phosphate/phosphite/phosphonate ABC transporter substrate-binding protein [Adhaeretor mobilis]QDS98009.1 Phosphate-import protein PhnD precursor [Adhaeretor mobilis]